MSNGQELYRTDYVQIGTTNRGCLRVIHTDSTNESENKESIFRQSKKVTQKDVVFDKIVAASQDGVLLCLQRKSGNTEIVFKTSTEPPITYVALGGALNTVLDKTFIATGGLIKGFSKKGKQFLSFETNITDPIESMYIYGVDMFLCSKTVFYHFHDCVERNCYVCPERINDILCLPVTEGGWVGRGITPVIACDDKTLKVFENGSQVYDVSVGDVPLILHLFMNDGGYNKQKVLYGTKSGRLGLVDLQKEIGVINWESPTQTTGGISCILCYKITSTGLSDIVIGKNDGTIEIYSIDDEESIHFQIIYQCKESITGLGCGRFNSKNVVEIIVGTYTGWIFALTTEPVKDQKKTLTTPQIEIKVQQFRTELDEIETMVQKERQRYKDQTELKPDTMTKIPPFSINDRFILDKDSMCYLLSIELVIPIEYIVLHSDADVELMDIPQSTAVVSFTKLPLEQVKIDGVSNQPPPKLLATYRCQTDTTRIELQIRSIEGCGGTLKAYVVPNMRPKMCQRKGVDGIQLRGYEVKKLRFETDTKLDCIQLRGNNACMRSYSIKPLALHERVHDFDSGRPMNTLTVKGDFSINEAHEWIAACVSQIPEKCPATDSVSYALRSTENGGTILHVFQTNNNAVYKSDSVSTIVIIRDVVSKITTNRKITVHMSIDMNALTIEHTIRLIHPKMELYSNLIKNEKLARGLRELESSFADLSFLTPELMNILRRHDELVQEVAVKKKQFNRILGTLTDLYVDKHKLEGANPKHKTQELLDLLSTDYSLDAVLTFFDIANS